MLKTIAASAVVCGLAASAWAAPATAVDVRPVVTAERAFADRAAEVGVAASFLEFMTDDAVIFGPEPVMARAFYGRIAPGRSPKEGGPLLNWWPAYAGIARSGDLAFTTGPATINGGKPGLFYFTVWARQKDGAWKWVYDGGIDADGAAAPGQGSQPLVMPPSDARPMAPALAMDQVRVAEIALAAQAKTDAVAAYKAALAPDARLQGSKTAPQNGVAGAERELATRAKAIAFGPLGGSASKAGDLAWTYGDAKWGSGRGHYVRIWQRRGGHWRLVFDQIIEVEKPA